MALVILIAAAIQVTQAEPARLPPTDRCGSDRSFVEYRARLWAAVARKDAAALHPLVASDIQIDLGDGKGWHAFVREWALNRPAESGLWRELSAVLELGCENHDGLRIMPGNFSKLSEYDHPLPIYFAVQKGAALLSQPDDSAPVVMTLEDHVLFENFDVAPEGWINARLSDGRSGFVRSSSVRSAIDYRAGFEKRNGNWVMTSLVAGD